MGTADGYVGACVQCRPGECARGSGPVRQWGGLGKSREWTGGCEGLVCNCVDCSNRGTLPCPVDLRPRRLISQYAAGGLPATK